MVNPLQAAIHQRHAGFIVKTQDFAGIAQQLDALLGQQFIAPVTGEKLFADQLLQALHLLADRGLGTTHCGGGGGEGVQISDRHKGAQQIEIEVEYRTCCINHLSSLTGG
jgi:hypothetical protein